MAGGVRCTRKLKQWMVQQVDSEKYPGLVWEDRKLGMFRIPWKHAGKQDYRHDEDAAIFKAWAQFKGKFKDGDKVDPATWKTRLRCALNKSSEFEEVPTRSQLDISEPYKVYKIIDDSSVKKRFPSSVPLSSVKMEGSENVGMETSRSSSPLCNPVGGTEEQVKSTAPSAESQLMDSDSSSDPSSGSEMSTQEEGSVSLDCILTPVTEVPPDYLINISSSITPSLPDKGPNSMCVVFYYSNVQVSSQVTRHGCRISSSAPSPRSDDAFGPQALEKLSFPPPDGVAQPEKLQATKELLTFLERGVMLDSNANGIFASRLCQGRVFWRGPCAPHPDRANKLERDRVEKLFDRQKFDQDLQQYQTLGVGSLPQYEVTLCFGEELIEADSLADKLITVQIYQVAAKQLIDRELELQTTSVILNQLVSENFSDRVTLALREASSSLYGIS